MSVYQFAINNMKNYIRSTENTSQMFPMTAFDAAYILSIAFMKSEGEVIADIVKGA